MNGLHGHRDRAGQFFIPLLIVVIVLIGLALRLYRLGDLVSFLDDQGRDVSIVANMLRTGEPVLVGPGSGYGQFQRGPAYYFFLTAGLAATGGDPVGAAASIGLLDAATIVLMFVAGRAVGGNSAGIAAAALYATAGAPIGLARGFTNPVVMSFFSLLLWLGVLGLARGKISAWVVVLFALVVGWQIHDQTWLLGIWTIGILLVLRPRLTWRVVGICAIFGLVLLLPFLMYEAQHDLVNVRAIFTFLTHATARGAQGNLLADVLERSRAVAQITFGFLPFAGIAHIVMVGATLASGVLLVYEIGKRRTREASLLGLYALLPILYLLWPGPVHASYLAIVLPIPFLLLGYGIARFAALNRYAPVVVSVLVLLVCGWSASQVFWKLHDAVPDSESLGAARAGVENIIAQAHNQPFLWRLDKQDKTTDEIETPWRYLLEWRGGQWATDPHAEGFVTYVPSERAGTLPGTDVEGNRIVRFEPPQRIDANLVQAGALTQSQDMQAWTLQANPNGTMEWDGAEGGGVKLRGDAMTEPLTLLERFKIEPDSDYVVTVSFRNALTRGAQQVYLLCFDTKRTLLAALPHRGGEKLPNSATWQRDLFWIHTPAGCARATLWLRQQGVGSSWFREVSAQRVVFGAAH